MSSEALKIGLYIGSWPQNIGNAFFDLGAKAILKAALPNAIFYPMGGAVHWMFEESFRYHAGYAKRIVNKLFKVKDSQNNSLEIGEYADIDILVFAGMSMCQEFIENNGRTFLNASKRGVKVLGLGTGAYRYTQEEKKLYGEFLQSLSDVAIITRDDATFAMFSGQIDKIASGIDCAFCLPQYYTPPRLDLPVYNAVNFDAGPIPNTIDHGDNMVIYTHHDLWGPLSKDYTAKPNTLVSDIPEDYLTLYAQVQETHSDRVHACVASLTYGNKARLYSKTPRKALFEKVGLPRITQEVSSINQDMLAELKAAQVAQTRKFVEQLMNNK
ncbi:polysaccharide pyruvyl transferase family protein [Oleidesulfovibrio alaskensis]|uniref:polysaccharide pyruvyl transferase family protein n=1 Tax=Oleidesulfovibrio alaskensis TaxID=58180 RepID=UPI001A46380E|nr:polysaccharide pyruvyl transferase family protein [Oleidesulfovibrio alaskensis]MBL3583587.1 polysaccharide pyruvyl transferase family protein [Oleidesulfovibrio alaskensis]